MVPVMLLAVRLGRDSRRYLGRAKQVCLCAWFVLLLSIVHPPLSIAHPVRQAEFQAEFQVEPDSLLGLPLPRGSVVGIYAYDLTDSVPLYDYQADRLCRPASTMKLLTAITALSTGTTDRPLRTELWSRGMLKGDTLEGDLIVVGGMDTELTLDVLDSLVRSLAWPADLSSALLSAPSAAPSATQSVAQSSASSSLSQPARKPIRVITGRVLGDISLRDSVYWGKGWAWDDAPDAFQPYLSPLILNRGTVNISIKPGRKGDTASISINPPSTFYTLSNQTRSLTPSAGPLTVSRDWMTLGNHIVAKGNVQRPSATQLSIFPSQDFFMHTFVERLQKAGISILGQKASDSQDKGTASDNQSKGEHSHEQKAAASNLNPIASLYGYDQLPHTASVGDLTLLTVYETPMQTLLEQMLKESDNLCAEALLTLLGHHTTGRRHISATDGIKAIEQLITRLGHDPRHYRLADGCGLSPYNYLSPRLLVDFLCYAYSRPEVYSRLLPALPTGGIDGTLQYRMPHGTPSFRRVHAKTGSVTGIYCLAGYLRTQQGHIVAFALMNQNVLTSRQARQFQDGVCDFLVEGGR